MRLLLSIALCASFIANAVAQTAPNGYTQFDAAQQAKLRQDVGTWRCVAVPASAAPTAIVETEQGNWFVARENGAAPHTSYERWSHSLKAYVLVTIFDSGALNVQQTSSLDPDNAVWTQVFPARDNLGRPRFDNVVSRAADVLRSTGRFYDSNGRVQTSTTTCTKQ